MDANKLVSDVTKIINQQMTRVQQAGWKCQACNVVNIIYGVGAALQCINCGSMALSKVWDHLLTTIETTETVV